MKTIDDIAKELGEIIEKQDNKEKRVDDGTFDTEKYKRGLEEYKGGW